MSWADRNTEGVRETEEQLTHHNISRKVNAEKLHFAGNSYESFLLDSAW